MAVRGVFPSCFASLCGFPLLLPRRLVQSPGQAGSNEGA